MGPRILLFSIACALVIRPAATADPSDPLEDAIVVLQISPGIST